MFSYFKWSLLSKSNSIHCSPGKCNSGGFLWLQIAVLQFRYEGGSTSPTCYSQQSNIQWTIYSEAWATIEMWHHSSSDHRVFFCWRNWQLQYWHCLYGEWAPVIFIFFFCFDCTGLSVWHHLQYVFQVLSRGMIVLHGFEKVQVRASNTITSGTMSFQLSVGGDLALVVQILAFCILPSENVVVGSAAFDTEMCFQNQVLWALASRFPMWGTVTCPTACELVLVLGVSAVLSSYCRSWWGKHFDYFCTSRIPVWPQRCRSEHLDHGARKTSECWNGIHVPLVQFSCWTWHPGSALGFELWCSCYI